MVWSWVLQSVIPTEKLREYIAYCRANCHPTISEGAARRLVETYVRMRSAGMSRKVGLAASWASFCDAGLCILAAELKANEVQDICTCISAGQSPSF